MNYFFTGLLLFGITVSVQAQKTAPSIPQKEVDRVLNTLASDDMRGRRAFTPDIDKAADFIAAEFARAGLQYFPGLKSFRQEFVMVRPKTLSVSGQANGQTINPRNIVAVTCEAKLKIDPSSGYETVMIKPGSNLQTEARKYIRARKNLLVCVDTSFATNFGNLARLRSSLFKTNTSVVFLLAAAAPSAYTIEITQEISEMKMSNVVGYLPGRSKKGEWVVFSGHYDHLGVGKPVNGDSIYNGANDDAAGTTAVILLADYFKALKGNERSLVFAAFTAEEVGGFGSQYFSQQFDPASVVAMFNIEMIGTESKWGKNTAYITGYEKTNMGEILAKDLNGTGFTFYPDPYPQQQLFYRSDNATLARLGVPAHTISTSKMDSEPHYHKLSDHVATLDLANMTEIIRAIGLSSRSIIAGKETPSRVKTEDLR